ncbi:BLUF domain-containing protein [Salinarimonas chemoclinalis]|uniref:BLUF domain-containing protein n=1 Tax=Salinarimonas chemoclinalis TaxID=3241599 RepID=UPI003557555C
MTTLARLVYVSRPRTTGRRGEFLAMCDEILVDARRRNADDAITGVLVAGPGLFAQVLEGDRTAVSGTFARICRDPRHEAIEILDMRVVDERRFAQWSMGFSDIDGAPEALVARFRQGRSPRRAGDDADRAPRLPGGRRAGAGAGQRALGRAASERGIRRRHRLRGGRGIAGEPSGATEPGEHAVGGRPAGG